MLSSVLCVVFIIINVQVKAIATVNPVVHLCYSKDTNIGKNYTVWIDKPLNIVIEVDYPRHVWCYSKYPMTQKLTRFIPVTEFNNDSIANLSVKNVTAVMSTTWVCTVFKKYQTPDPPYEFEGRTYSAKNLYFNLHVRGAKRVILTTNGRSLPYVTTNLSVNYDGEASYTYVEGEDLEISCKMELDPNESSTLRMEYYNAAGTLLFQTKSREKKPHLFRIVFKSDYNNYYLECIRATEFPRKEYRYRTTFLKKKGDLQAATLEHAMILLFVNGQQLTTIFNKDLSYDDYIVRYVGEGVLNVTCRKKDHTVRGSLSVYIFNTETDQQGFPILGDPSTVITVNISKSTLRNKNLTCGINNTDVLKPNARMLFLLDELGYDVRMQGLASNNIMYQYTNDENQWTLEYQYSVNETLNLTCELNHRFRIWSNEPADKDFFRWTFKGISNNTPAEKSPIYSSMKWSQQRFTINLDATHNTLKLRCIYFPNGCRLYNVNNSVELILRLKPESEAESEKVENISGEGSKVIVPIAVSVGAAIGIITMICLVLWCKRTKRIHLIENEYLSNHNDSSIPAFPSQWETNCDDSHYAKIDEQVIEENDTYTTDTDKLYIMPYKRQSNTSENHYTEIDDCRKPNPDGLAINWHPSNFNKEKGTLKGTPSHKSNNTTQNNFCDLKQGTYDTLSHDNLPINKKNENYSSVQKTGKSKTVTFRQMSNDLRPPRNFSEGTSRQHCGNNDRRLKQSSDGHCIYMQPGDLPKKPNYENHFLQNEKSENSDYAEPYGDIAISCKNEFYG